MIIHRGQLLLIAALSGCTYPLQTPTHCHPDISACLQRCADTPEQHHPVTGREDEKKTQCQQSCQNMCQ